MILVYADGETIIDKPAPENILITLYSMIPTCADSETINDITAQDKIINIAALGGD